MADAYLTNEIVKVFEWSGHIVVQTLEPFVPDNDYEESYAYHFYISDGENLPRNMIYDRLKLKFLPFKDTVFVPINNNACSVDDAIFRASTQREFDRSGKNKIFEQTHKSRIRRASGLTYYTTFKGVVWVLDTTSPDLTGILEFDKLVDTFRWVEIDTLHPRSLQ